MYGLPTFALRLDIRKVSRARSIETVELEGSQE